MGSEIFRGGFDEGYPLIHIQTAAFAQTVLVDLRPYDLGMGKIVAQCNDLLSGGAAEGQDFRWLFPWK